MNQEWMIKDVLAHLDSVPDSPKNGRVYLTLDEATAIVDETVNYLGAHGDETEYTYMNGHRKRLAHSLTMIPKSQGDNESLLDIGSYGYMCLWAKKHLGYQHVVGIEWHPHNPEPIIHRTIALENDSIIVESHNFDISQTEWKLDTRFDTVLFFEVLEHINHDPMGVMERIHGLLKPKGTLVMSVPNAISYKALKEFLVGMPPWTYWFYEPDLSHEPRHCFEYTPIIFKMLIQASGLQENAFRTIYAYSDIAREQRTLEISRSLGIEDEDFGETMIINASRISDQINLRFPDALYSPNGYYKNIYPHIQGRLDQTVDRFRKLTYKGHPQSKPVLANEHTSDLVADSLAHRTQLDELLFTCDSQLQVQEQLQQRIEQLESEHTQIQKQLKETQDWAHDLQSQKYDHESRINELLFACDCYLRAEGELDDQLQAADEKATLAQNELAQTRTWAENLSAENADMRAQINELLFMCDCYLQQVNDPGRCVQVIREQQFRRALRVSKSVARKTPILRSALRPVYRNTKKFIKRRM